MQKLINLQYVARVGKGVQQQYHMHAKFRGLDFCLKISNYFCGSLILRGVNFSGRTPYFILKDAIKYCACVCILKLTFQWFLALSMP